MASRMMKKATSSVISVANRTPRRNYTSAILIIPLKTSIINTSANVFRQIFRTTSIPTYLYFCALAKKRANDTLLRDIDEEFDDLEAAEIPIEFPFKIEDNPEEKYVTLTREYEGEEIKLTVRKLDPSRNSDYKYKDEVIGPRCVELDVSVTKESGTLIFDVMLDADYANWIAIKRVAVKNPNDPHEDNGYDFSSLNWLVHNPFRTYLRDRGIEPSTTKFLNDYMDNKKRKADTAFLRNFKKLIAN